MATALVLAVLAAGFAAWSGWSLYRASSAGPPASAQLRDQVLQAGEQAVQNFNTLDYRKVAAGLALWEQSSTGPLHAEISAGRAQFTQQIEQTKTVTTARILDGALTALNSRADTASIMVAVQITVTPAQRIAGHQAEPPARHADQDAVRVEAQRARPGPGRRRVAGQREGLRRWLTRTSRSPRRRGTRTPPWWRALRRPRSPRTRRRPEARDRTVRDRTTRGRAAPRSTAEDAQQAGDRDGPRSDSPRSHNPRTGRPRSDSPRS